MKIAVVGAGVSGLTAAYLLREAHDLTLFEARAVPGGHTRTCSVRVPSGSYDVDVGFIVLNEENYPNFIRLLRRLDVEWQPSDMSFGVKDEVTGLTFSPSGLGGLLAQPTNGLRPRFWRMIAEILRFRRILAALGDDPRGDRPLAEIFEAEGFREDFVNRFILPMGAAIWSCPTSAMRDFPAKTFARFFCRHRFLDVRGQPRWQTVKGRSHQYVRKIRALLGERLRLSSPVRSVRRSDGRAHLTLGDGSTSSFDAVVLAVHSDQALAMLEDPSRAEADILGAIPYQPNHVLLHTDEAVLPSERRARASWNYRIRAADQDAVLVTYDMNRLQSIEAPETFLVTLNWRDGVDPARRLFEIDFAHPVFTVHGTKAQLRWDEISGVGCTHFCGAYWGYGFHEDGVTSALEVVRSLGGETL